MGKYVVGDFIDNGERFISMCEKNDFVIGGSFFVYKIIYKLIWILLDGYIKS